MNYRKLVASQGLSCFRVKIEESDLFVCAKRNLARETEDILLSVREQLKGYIKRFPNFARSLVPVEVEESAPEIVKIMAESAKLAGVGPMAAVAGAIAELVGRHLLGFSEEVIVENGGDIFLKTEKERVVSIYAGSSPFSMKIGIKLEKGRWGVATSSGTVGHSLSFGRADAAVVVARSSAVADAFATAVGNRVKSASDIEPALEWIKGFFESADISGAVVILGHHFGACGDLELCRL